MKRLEWYIARRYLASRRRGRFLSLITLIAIGGVFLGVMSLITVIGVMTGLQEDLRSKILGSNPHIYVFDSGRDLRLGHWRSVLPRVQGAEGVVAAEPYVMTAVGVVPKDVHYFKTGNLLGFDPSFSPEPLTVIERELRAGTVAFGPTVSGLPGAIVGSGLANNMGLLPGDTIIVISGENIRFDPLGNPVPETAELEVVSTFRTGMYEYDESNIYVEMATAQDLLGLPPDTVTGIWVNIRDPMQAPEVADRLALDLGHQYFIDNWINLNGSLFSALKLEKMAMAVILFMIVLVAAFNIVSTLVMVVADKTREIGILKGMGLTNRAVLRIFILQGVTIGLIGTALGALGGLGLTTVLDRYGLIKLPGDVYFIETLPVALEPTDFIMIVTISVVIAFVATIYPARQASKLLPVEAIRHE
ncbi:MAG: FtsX-like permease family protein [Gemmatimonadota bacterium]|jgi:lipoprotein-releasing system permease protein